MTILAAACGILIVCLGLLSTALGSKAPTDGQFAIQIICLVGGLILCFLAVILSRLTKLARRLDDIEEEAGDWQVGDNDPAPG